MVKQRNLSSQEFTFLVDYSETVKQLISDGNYTFCDEGFDEQCINRKKTTNSQLIVFAKFFYFKPETKLNSEEIIALMSKKGFQPANLLEFLTFAIIYPKLQLKFPILSLDKFKRRVYPKRPLNRSGFGYEGGKHYYRLGTPCLDSSNSETELDNQTKRSLCVYIFSTDWPKSAHFLAIRK